MNILSGDLNVTISPSTFYPIKSASGEAPYNTSSSTNQITLDLEYSGSWSQNYYQIIATDSSNNSIFESAVFEYSDRPSTITIPITDSNVGSGEYINVLVQSGETSDHVSHLVNDIKILTDSLTLEAAPQVLPTITVAVPGLNDVIGFADGGGDAPDNSPITVTTKELFQQLSAPDNNQPIYQSATVTSQPSADQWGRVSGRVQITTGVSDRQSPYGAARLYQMSQLLTGWLYEDPDPHPRYGPRIISVGPIIPIKFSPSDTTDYYYKFGYLDSASDEPEYEYSMIFDEDGFSTLLIEPRLIDDTSYNPAVLIYDTNTDSLIGKVYIGISGSVFTSSIMSGNSPSRISPFTYSGSYYNTLKTYMPKDTEDVDPVPYVGHSCTVPAGEGAARVNAFQTGMRLSSSTTGYFTSGTLKYITSAQIETESGSFQTVRNGYYMIVGIPSYSGADPGYDPAYVEIRQDNSLITTMSLTNSEQFVPYLFHYGLQINRYIKFKAYIEDIDAKILESVDQDNIILEGAN